eukprot:INCI6805.1.p1 GENE.INCI6805.1~~INCI6805.1.p1  ORF type:complete len:199 (-),score=18.31 INCI6805.1:67-663(-)
MLLFAKGSVSGARSSAFYTFFFLALSCLSSGQRVAVAAHPHSGTACSSAAENNIPLLSYHVHVLFWPSNNDSTAAAMKLQADFIEAFDLVGKPNCTFQAGDPAANVTEICAFEVDWEPAGPFLTAQYSFFVPRPLLTDAWGFAVQNRGKLDILVHPNSGCEVEDHTSWALWAGNPWELDASIFSCEHPGCVPKPGLLY